jgi:hypothetical protein
VYTLAQMPGMSIKMPYVEVELAGMVPMPDQEMNPHPAKKYQPLLRVTEAFNTPSPSDPNFNSVHLVLQGLMPMEASCKIAMNIRVKDKAKSGITPGATIGVATLELDILDVRAHDKENREKLSKVAEERQRIEDAGEDVDRCVCSCFLFI